MREIIVMILKKFCRLILIGKRTRARCSRQRGADYFKEDTNEAAHGIAYFFNNINNLQEGTYKWNGSSWECTTCK